VCRCCGSGGGRRPAIEIAEQLRDETLDEFRSRVRGQAGMTMFFIQVPSVVGTDREEVQEYRRNTVSIDAITTNQTPSDSNGRHHPYSHCTAHEHAGFSAGFGAGFGALFGAVFGAADAAEAANADAEAPTERDAVGDATGRVETAAQPSTSSDFQSGCWVVPFVRILASRTSAVRHRIHVRTRFGVVVHRAMRTDVVLGRLP